VALSLAQRISTSIAKKPPSVVECNDSTQKIPPSSNTPANSYTGPNTTDSPSTCPSMNPPMLITEVIRGNYRHQILKEPSPLSKTISVFLSNPRASFHITVMVVLLKRVVRFIKVTIALRTNHLNISSNRYSALGPRLPNFFAISFKGNSPQVILSAQSPSRSLGKRLGTYFISAHLAFRCGETFSQIVTRQHKNCSPLPLDLQTSTHGRPSRPSLKLPLFFYPRRLHPHKKDFGK
jgi:hypothetical protein